jgi:hypothetical protein
MVEQLFGFGFVISLAVKLAELLDNKVARLTPAKNLVLVAAAKFLKDSSK